MIRIAIVMIVGKTQKAVWMLLTAAALWMACPPTYPPILRIAPNKAVPTQFPTLYPKLEALFVSPSILRPVFHSP